MNLREQKTPPKMSLWFQPGKMQKQHFSLLFVPPAKGGGMEDYYGNYRNWKRLQ